MAIAHDAATNVAGGTGNLSWTHTPAGTPRGALVMVIQGGGISATTDQVTGVTYGGVAMTEVSGSPLVSGAGNDFGAVYVYFLGSSVPTGNQTVEVTVSGAADKRAVAVTVTAAANVEIEDTSVIDSASLTNPALTLTTGASTVTQSYGALFSGQATPASIAVGADTTEILEHDFGAQMGVWARGTNTDAGGDFTLNWTIGTADNVLAIGVALKEASAPPVTTPVREARRTLSTGIYEAGRGVYGT